MSIGVEERPVEMLLAMRAWVTREVAFEAAAGTGLDAGYGAPSFRALAGLRWLHRPDRAPPPPVDDDLDDDGIANAADKCPREPETRNDFEDTDGCPDNADADGDGIALPLDKCPAIPETKNGFEDEDGCADELPDTDGDGLRDPIDGCPTEPEDADGFKDEDGCPDLDNDNDGVVDLADRCKNDPGPVGNGGCPDTDRDGDTVVDRLDNCPDEPGTVKNFGCKEKQLVVMLGTQIKLLDVVHFDTGKATIKRQSHRLLNNVAKVILAHPEIVKVTVEGHTDDQGEDAMNKDLSQRRADSVVQFLVKASVSIDKLVSIGHGEEKPVESNKSAKGRAANRRVEFKVQGIAAEPAPPVPATPPPAPTPATPAPTPATPPAPTAPPPTP
jgi:outer membrane protein OmpA-like peptidoglycan-associated protein